jgi:uncharacterized protein YkwD
MKIRAVAAAFLLAGGFLILTSCDLFGPSIVSIAEIEKDVFDRVNAQRDQAGLPPLAWEDRIADAARGHSQDMAAGAVPFGHDGFEDRIARIGATLPYQAAGEVVAFSGSAKEAVAAWIASPTHKAILEGVFDLTGVGVAENENGAGFYIDQIFIRTR